MKTNFVFSNINFIIVFQMAMLLLLVIILRFSSTPCVQIRRNWFIDGDLIIYYFGRIDQTAVVKNPWK